MAINLWYNDLQTEKWISKNNVKGAVSQDLRTQFLLAVKTLPRPHIIFFRCFHEDIR